MKYTALYGHMESESKLLKGQIVQRGAKIGTMGSTGKSSSNHVHLGLRKGIYGSLFRMSDIEVDRDLLTQLAYFTDKEFFNFDIVITSFFADPRYTSEGAFLFHSGYDIVPADRHLTKDHYDFYWNRSKPGTVLNKGFDPNGYGNWILISYET